MAFWSEMAVDQDFVDSANGFWSVWLLVVCCLGSFLMRYVMQPVTCFPPAEFTEAQVSYAENICFQKNTFYLPTPFNPSSDTRRNSIPAYHLWIPLLLALQAFGFKLPNIIWKACKHYLSVNLEKTLAVLPNERHDAAFKNTSKILAGLLRRNKVLLAILYLFVKFLYSVNLALQFVFLTLYFRPFLSMKISPTIGKYVDNLIHPYFIKTVSCQFEMTFLSNIRTHSMQCNLNLSEVYEKLYIFLWVWIIILAVITNLNLLLWLGQLFLPFLRDSRISIYLNPLVDDKLDDGAVNRFVSNVLGIDGVFLVSMISQNSSETVAASLVQEIFLEFEERKGHHVSSPTVESSGAPTVESSRAPPVESSNYISEEATAKMEEDPATSAIV